LLAERLARLLPVVFLIVNVLPISVLVPGIAIVGPADIGLDPRDLESRG
jgi:hypothetical protein